MFNHAFSGNSFNPFSEVTEKLTKIEVPWWGALVGHIAEEETLSHTVDGVLSVMPRPSLLTAF